MSVLQAERQINEIEWTPKLLTELWQRGTVNGKEAAWMADVVQNREPTSTMAKRLSQQSGFPNSLTDSTMTLAREDIVERMCFGTMYTLDTTNIVLVAWLPFVLVAIFVANCSVIIANKLVFSSECV